MSVVAPSFSGETPFLVCIARPLPPEEAGLRRADCPLRTASARLWWNPGLGGGGVELLFCANGEKGRNRRGFGLGGPSGL